MNDNTTPEGVFADIAARDAKGQATEHESSMLRQPENVARWIDALVTIGQGIEGQMTAARARLDEQEAIYEAVRRSSDAAAVADAALAWKRARAGHSRWLAGASHVRSCVRMRQREAKDLRHQLAMAEHAAQKAHPSRRHPEGDGVPRRALLETVDDLRTRVERLEEQLAVAS